MLPATPEQRHRVVAASFGDLVAGVTDWSAPAPVPDWTARDVVSHLVDWFTGFLAAGGVGLEPGPAVDADPVAAWRRHTSQVQALLDGPSATAEFTHPQVGTMPLAVAVDNFYTADVFMHSWDLAQASGQDLALDEDQCAAMLAGMAPMEEMLRGSGQYGPAVAVPDDASAQDRLMGFIGRDPAWRA
ncbi:MAG TPA: TIGR03086 family metal-binding protein [Gordonia sp. (in: high G+C Gram-positive bacteria)]|uniref:TIGR03086 family metal-binding protein n=1 Tax=unclassified Gordonia (in: high G+C Gram-positive bacteria) TaxID=2657482 RepID=UPI000FB3AE04|nr:MULTISPECIES: TIGR03086 family metal-binding protein [unclassified Gordonia (in: high G+C Gram-positive bacteria)]RUP36709.1 MAG: TIGR03086 family protein [Gordonia sp. (in: high G+C Gram-positive bacteria)]HNP55655.1 TIGR03086 family metal-binding protein [Gordonia sp. (in: high G+C Gram-positive bacteria)]HRC52630.1 TIGR03086 family metal-binding protein [Gordonia sp. (in: high G+C Gram-positive bacteria)]